SATSPTSTPSWAPAVRSRGPPRRRTPTPTAWWRRAGPEPTHRPPPGRPMLRSGSSRAVGRYVPVGGQSCVAARMATGREPGTRESAGRWPAADGDSHWPPADARHPAVVGDAAKTRTAQREVGNVNRSEQGAGPSVVRGDGQGESGDHRR